MMILIMGVTGCGKTTIGAALAHELGWSYFDADDFHPLSNIQQMSSGLPLTDQDRGPWLEKLRRLIAERHRHGEHGVLACSALKETYREILGWGGDLEVVYLKADPDLIAQRLATRKGHFMPQRLIDSQFRDLEEPNSGITIPAAWSPERIVKAARTVLGI
jgi:gluconokinase